jgi:type I restriction enzyme M protein
MAAVSDHLSQKELESYLWGAATLLRGLIDASDYKQYIFPLLFFKRLSDVWDEDYREAFEDSQDEGYATATANDRFTIPEGAHWKDARDASRDVGRALLNAYQAIEAANPQRLQGVFGNAAWTDKAQMPDETLKNLIEHFSKHTLSLANVPEDELGNGYEYLIKQFADDSGHTAQEFYTNRTLVHLMAQMLEPKAGETIYDPTCGTGGMLISCLAEVKRKGGDTRTMGLYGQELINITAAIARMNLVLHGVSDFDIRSGNTLHAPAFIEGDRLKTFDVVLANPPYSISAWNRGAWLDDPWRRNMFGAPPQSSADLVFVQHIIASMDPTTGRSISLLPHGFLARSSETDVRTGLIESDKIEAIIGLGRGLFYNSGMESCLLVCRSQKCRQKMGKILFIDASNEVKKEKSISFLEPSHQARILEVYRAYGNEDGFSSVVDLETIRQNNYSLGIAFYVREGAERSDPAALQETWQQFAASSVEFWSGMDSLVTHLDQVLEGDRP